MLVACTPTPSIKPRCHSSVDEEGAVVTVYVPSDVMQILLSILGAVDAWVEGREWRDQVRSRSRAALDLSATCKLSRATLLQTGESIATNRLCDELSARTQTDVLPLFRGVSTPYPLIRHMLQEQASMVLLTALKCADEEVAYHCAGQCCAHARTSTNRKLKKRLRNFYHYRGRPANIMAVASSVREFAACADEAVCFAHTCYGRKRGGSGPTHALTKFRIEDRSVVVCAQQLNTTHRGLDVLWMAAAPGGKAVAYIAYDSDASQQDIPVVGVWAPCNENSHRRIYVGAEEVLFSDTAPFPISTTNPNFFYTRLPVKFPQQIWWRAQGAEQPLLLIVVWSTTQVHPIGDDSLEGDFALPSRCERYYFATYEITGLCGKRPLNSYCRPIEGPFKGRIIRCSASLDGKRIVTLYRAERTSTEDMEPVMKCSVHHTGCSRDLPTCSPRIDDLPSQGPMAVGMSPAGDCIVCVIQTSYTTVSAQVFDLDEHTRYRLVCNQELTDFIACHATVAAMPVGEVVKLRYAISFSHCGRYATVFDQRARWGAPMTGYAAVVLDVGNRRRCQKLPCHPLCYCECDDEYTLRSIACTPIRAAQWSANQVWIMSHRGLLVASL